MFKVLICWGKKCDVEKNLIYGIRKLVLIVIENYVLCIVCRIKCYGILKKKKGEVYRN